MSSDLRAPSDGPQLVHKPMHRAWFSVATWTVALIAAVTFCLLIGCNKGDATSTVVLAKPPAAHERTTAPGPKQAIRNQLVGVWLGTTYLDENELSDRLEGCSEDEVDDFVRQAQYFSSTVMAIDFKSDGTLENEIEIAPPGSEPIRQAGVGTWQVVEIRDDQFVVEIAEENADGSIVKSRKIYKFDEDGDHFAVSIPLEDLLGQCNPLLVFERQYLDKQGVLAEAPGETQRK